MDVPGYCFLCKTPCVDKCSSSSCASRNVYFCCSEHEMLHRTRPVERDLCFPYEVVQKEGIGRCLVATRKIEPGELIFQEDALTIGPLHDTKPVCLGCLTEVSGDHLCPECHLPLCGSDSCGSPSSDHSRFECRIFSRAIKENIGKRFEIKDYEADHPLYQCIMPIRCLMLKEMMPERWKAVEAMMSHATDRPHDDNWRVDQNNTVKYLRDHWKFDFTEDEVNHVIGILEVNAFEINRGRGVFPLTALMSHDCVANSRYIMFEDNHAECRATVVIEKGEEITDYYVSTLNGTSHRRSKLRDGWYFECKCRRCKDSSELGTNLDALLCLKCSGPILPEDPIDFNSSVKCFKCAEIYDKDQIRQSESDFLQEIDECDKKDPKAMETLLDKCQSSLYPTHYLIIALKRHLIYAYGRIPGYFLNELSEESIRRKHSYCQEILTIYEVIAPGFTKERGLTIFELCSVNLFLLKQSLGSPEEKKRNIQVLKEITKCLEEVINCLQYEKTCSFEDMVCKAAQREITQCKQLLEVIELLL